MVIHEGTTVNSASFDEVIKKLEELGPVTAKGEDHRAACPHHNGESLNSLSVKRGDDNRALICCHAGCEFLDIITALGLQYTKNNRPHKPSKQRNQKKPNRVNTALTTPSATYNYNDEFGGLSLRKLRYETNEGEKTFLWEHYDGESWQTGYGNNTPTLYRSAHIQKAVSREETVYVAEGEKDVDTLVSYGFTATTGSGGAGTWREVDTAALYGAHVVILPDNDSAGAKHAEIVAKNIYKHAKSVKIVELPGLPEKGDVTDWMDDIAHTSAELKAVVNSVSMWKPTVRFTGHSLRDLRNLPQREWLVEGLLARGESAMIRGPSGSGKTFVTIDLIKSLLTRQPWMDEHAINPNGDETLTVAYTTNEGTRALADRFESALDGQIDTPGLQVFIDVPQLFDQDGESGVLQFMEDYLAQYESTPDVLVIDTLSAAAVGAEENSAKDMNVVMSAVKQIQADWDCSVILLHHDGKHTGQERGSTVLRASMDLVLAVSENADSEPRSVRVDKCKDGPGGDVFAFQLEELGPSVVVRWNGSWDACETAQTAASTYTREIISLLQEQRDIQSKEAAIELGITERLASRSLEQLTDIGLLIKTKGRTSQNGGRPPWLYSIVSGDGKKAGRGVLAGVAETLPKPLEAF